jgi:hypothetical protein
MTYNQYNDHIKLCEYLGREPSGDFRPYYDFFNRLWENMEITVDKVIKHRIIFHKEGKCVMLHNLKTNNLWFTPFEYNSYNIFGNFFTVGNSDEYILSKYFLDTMIRKHLSITNLFLMPRILTDEEIKEITDSINTGNPDIIPIYKSEQ